MNELAQFRAKRRQRSGVDGYLAFLDQCVIVTACSAKYVPYLINAMDSMDINFPNWPLVVVYDLGISRLQRAELSRRDNVELRAMPTFVKHWRLNWSWKLHAMTAVQNRFVLYLDLPNFVVLRSLAQWFNIIRKHGYLLVSNGQKLGDITPSDYWSIHEMDVALMHDQPTFGAGIVGFDRESDAGRAVESALIRVQEGLNLGRSANEASRLYRPHHLVRDCKHFRADQTLLNLAFRQRFGTALYIRKALRFCGVGGRSDHVGQYLWYARRAYKSLGIGFEAPSRLTLLKNINRLLWMPGIQFNRFTRLVISRLHQRR